MSAATAAGGNQAPRATGAEALGTHKFAYDAQGRVEAVVGPDGLRASLRYDERGRIATLARAARTESYRYDRRGFVTGLDEPAGRWAITTDPLLRRRSITYPGGEKVVHQYAPDGRLERVAWDDNRHFLHYTRDLLGQPTLIRTPVGDFKIGHDQARRLVTREYPNGALSQFEFNRQGRATRIQHATPDHRVFLDFAYRYDERQRLVETKELGPQGSVTISFRYDAYGQLLAATRSDGRNSSYAYDPAGNLLSLSEPSHSALMSYGSGGRLASYNGSPVEHDAAGNVTRLDKVEYAHDFRGRLTRAGGTRYSHSALNLRRAASGPAAEQRFLHLLGESARVLADTGPTVRRYLWDDDSLLGQIEGDRQVLFFFEDQLGSIRAAMDAQGRVVGFADFTPFGTPTQRIPGLRFGFAGEEQDEDGRIFLRARTYEPRIGRFLSKDPLPPRLFDLTKQNRYAYAANAPTNFTDRGGLQASARKQELVRPTFDEVQRYLILLMQDESLDLVQLSQVVGREDDIWPRNWDINRVVVQGFGEVDMNHLVSQMFYPSDFVGSAHRDARYATLGPYMLFKDVWADLRADKGDTLRNDVADLRGNVLGTVLNMGAIDLAPRVAPAFRKDFIDSLNHWIGSSRSKKSMPLLESIRQIWPPRPELFHIYRNRFQQQQAPQTPPAKSPAGNDRDQQTKAITDVIMSAMRDAEQAIAQHPVSGGSGRTAGPGGYASAEALEAVAAFKAMRNRQVPSVGGVWLGKAAEAVGELGRIDSVSFDPAGQRLLLVGADARSANLPPLRLDHLASAFASVYGSANEEPGVTIDPLPDNPRGPQMLVRFFGGVENSAFGQTLFEADRVMKSLSLGEDNVTHQAVGVKVPGYGNLAALDLASRSGNRDGNLWSRFWLVPERVLVQLAADKQSISFPDTRIRIKTETMRWQGAKLVPAGSEKDDKAEHFAAHFTEHYDAYAREHPVFHELKGLTNMVGLAKWLKESGVPADLGWLERHRRAAPTPTTTPSHQVTRERGFDGGVTRSVTVFGGADLTVQNRYVEDAGAATAALAQRARRAVAGQPGLARAEWAGAGPARQRVLALPTSLTKAPEAMLLAQDELGLVTRLHCSAHNEPGPFGHGWQLDMPRLQITWPDKKERGWVSVGNQKVALREFRLTRPFGLADITFKRHAFDAERDRIAFVPERGGQGVRALYPDADDAGFRVEFVNGLVQTFDARGRLLRSEASGVALAYRHDAQDRLVAVELARDKTTHARLSLAYDAQGRISSADTPSGPVQYRYDAASDLRAVEHAAGRIDYRYDERHVLAGVSVNGRESATYSTDALGALTASRTPGQASLGVRSQASGEQQLVTRRIDNQDFVRRYDIGGRLHEARFPSGAALRAESDTQGRLQAIEATNRFGDTSRIQYSPDGRQMSLVDAEQGRLDLRFDDFGRLLQLQAAGQPVVTRGYGRTTGGWLETTETTAWRTQNRSDTQGRVAESLVTAKSPGGGQLRLRASYASGAAGALEQIDADGLLTAQWVFRDGRLVAHSVGADKTSYTYDASARLSKISSAAAAVDITRGADGSVTRVETTRGAVRDVAEFNAGAPTQRTLGTERTDRFGYDAQGRLASVAHSDGDAWSVERGAGECALYRRGALQLRLRFDSRGRLLEVTE